MINCLVICVLNDKKHFSVDWSAVLTASENVKQFRLLNLIYFKMEITYSTMSEKSRIETACGDRGKTDHLSGA